MEFQPVKPSFELLFQARVTVGSVVYVSNVPPGERHFIPVTCGSFEGEKLSGDVLPGGANWQLVRPDDSVFLHARYALRTNDNVPIYVENNGIRWGSSEVLAQLARGEAVDPSRYYFRTTSQFETGATQYSWLNNIIAVCPGARLVKVAIVDLYSVL
jgi:hypothetical protein